MGTTWRCRAGGESEHQLYLSQLPFFYLQKGLETGDGEEEGWRESDSVSPRSSLDSLDS